MIRRLPRDSGRPMIEIGVDIGGTFTDVVCIDSDIGSIAEFKILTTHEDPAVGVLDGLAALTQSSGESLADVGRIVHGTTLVTNAVITRRGGRTGMLTTSGFRDVIEMRREHRQDLYDLHILAPDPIIPRELRLEVKERVGADGQILEPLQEEAALEQLGRLVARGVTSVAICLLHAYRNPAHERRLRDIATATFPGLATSLSSEVAPVMREYERFSTTAINAYTQPLIATYLEDLERALRRRQFSGTFHVMLSDGGVAPASTAAKFPARLLESGPAAGMIAAAEVARDERIGRAIGFDMGGTTAKCCVIRDGKADTRADFEVARSDRFKRGSGLAVALPVVDMIEIGAGGGSIAKADRLGLLKVGPESAESDPGPACYGRGGKQGTVTDADLLLGYLDAGEFAGGAVILDADASDAAVADIGRPLHMQSQDTAWAIFETVNEAMATAVRVHLTEKGEDARTYSLIAFGGAGPVHAVAVAAKVGITRVVVPGHPGVGSAVGLITSPVSYEVARTYEGALSRLVAVDINTMLEEMETGSRALLGSTRPDRISLAVEMRYVGQTHTLTVGLPAARLPEEAGPFLRRAFEDEYRRQYGATVQGDVEVEAINWRLTAMASAVLTTPRPPVGRRRRDARRRRVWFGPRVEDSMDCRVVQREELSPGEELGGPLIVQEPTSTTLVPPGYKASVRTSGALYIELEDAAP